MMMFLHISFVIKTNFLWFHCIRIVNNQNPLIFLYFQLEDDRRFLLLCDFWHQWIAFRLDECLFWMTRDGQHVLRGDHMCVFPRFLSYTGFFVCVYRFETIIEKRVCGVWSFVQVDLHVWFLPQHIVRNQLLIPLKHKQIYRSLKREQIDQTAKYYHSNSIIVNELDFTLLKREQHKNYNQCTNWHQA